MTQDEIKLQIRIIEGWNSDDYRYATIQLRTGECHLVQTDEIVWEDEGVSYPYRTLEDIHKTIGKIDVLYADIVSVWHPDVK